MNEELPASVPNVLTVGWHDDEVLLTEPTRSSRLRWVVVVDGQRQVGAMVNAVACVAAHAGHAVAGLLGPVGIDADGGCHPGLPWAGCTVLAAPADVLLDLRRKALAAGDVAVYDVPRSAQTNRVYAEYLTELTRTPSDALELAAVSLFGPRNRISKLTGKLPLLP